LINYETIINLIGGARTRTGLKIKAVLDTNEYETGIKVSDEQLERDSDPAPQSPFSLELHDLASTDEARKRTQLPDLG
jgi:hypothetical protein